MTDDNDDNLIIDPEHIRRAEDARRVSLNIYLLKDMMPEDRDRFIDSMVAAAQELLKLGWRLPRR